MITEIAYLAGLIDGEGTITITRHKQYDRPHWVCKTFVWVSNTDRKLIKLLKRRHGGSCGLKGKPRLKHHKANLYWRVMSHANIERILKACLPFLVIKKRQAKILLKFIASRNRNNKAQYSKQELSYQTEIRKLNGRKIS